MGLHNKTTKARSNNASQTKLFLGQYNMWSEHIENTPRIHEIEFFLAEIALKLSNAGGHQKKTNLVRLISSREIIPNATRFMSTAIIYLRQVRVEYSNYRTGSSCTHSTDIDRLRGLRHHYTITVRTRPEGWTYAPRWLASSSESSGHYSRCILSWFQQSV